MRGACRSGRRDTLVRLAGAVLLCLGLAGAIARAADYEIRVVPLHHRLPDEVIPVLRPLLANGESISGHDTKLIIKAAPATLGEIERALREVDIPRRNLRIHVEIVDAFEHRQQDLGVTGRYQNGSTRVIATDGVRRAPNVVARGGRGNEVEVHAERRFTTRPDTAEQTLVVLDGGRGSWSVDESIAEVRPFLALAGERLAVAAGVEYQNVTTGFEAEPHVIGDQVRLRINPRLSFRFDHGDQTVSFRELQTEVVIPLGQWFDLGEILDNANTVNRQILGAGQSTATARTGLRVRVDPM